MNCPNCGNEIPENQARCSRGGAAAANGGPTAQAAGPGSAPAQKKKKGGAGKLILLLLLAGVAAFLIFRPKKSADAQAALPKSASYTPVFSDYSRSALPDETARKLYDDIAAVIYEDPTAQDDDYRFPMISIDNDTTDTEIFLAYRAFTDDHPEVFWLKTYRKREIGKTSLSDKTTYLDLYSSYSEEELKTEKEKLNAALGRFLDSVPAGLDAAGLQKYAHDYLLDHCAYDYDAIDAAGGRDRNYARRNRVGEVTGALADGKAVCAGYAKAYQLMLNRLGVDCVPVYGAGSPLDPELQLRTTAVNHQWNAVKADGAWVMTDATWDDVEDAAKRYEYYNVPVSRMYEDHNARKIDLSTFTYTNSIILSGLYSNENWDCLFLPEG